MPRIQPLENDDLVDDVQDERDEKQLCNVLPTIAYQAQTIARMREDAPTIGGPARSGIGEPRPNAENCRHSRLNEQAKRKRTYSMPIEHFPMVQERITHRSAANLRLFSHTITALRNFERGSLQ